LIDTPRIAASFLHHCKP